MPILTPITKAEFLVYAQGIDLFFTTFNGLNDTAESGSYANGTGNRIYSVVGPRKLDDLELSSPYDPILQQAVEEFWLNYSCAPLVITVQPVLCDGLTENGPAYIFEGCLLKSISQIEVDRESSDVSVTTLGFTANS